MNCMTHPGKATIARLNRKEGKYRMTLIPAEFVTLPEEKMAETTMEWPHVFAKLPLTTTFSWRTLMPITAMPYMGIT